MDAYVEYGLHAWDMAAPAVVLLEAGGVMFDPSGMFSITCFFLSN